ncbi:hypothetical protein DERF_014297 [Dermatophagoides farinae]|uniref:Uncharacterized protein n=1 Tax=Dermatophagoides farinae TaxID=6954 RepID=A0A922KU23_DERFA|nr:hypothetical protein DERF_014297 [Dermatophagoides farinae]
MTTCHHHHNNDDVDVDVDDDDDDGRSIFLPLYQNRPITVGLVIIMEFIQKNESVWNPIDGDDDPMSKH